MLPIASAILWFKNPNIYQIIDQRAYIVLQAPTDYNIDSQIEIYIQHPIDLNEMPTKTVWGFSMLDFIFYWR